ncbi:hypothetical protein KEM54_000750 [Ascosphaera aggregata]|nr:hypothetical protein KEM54_000750 [Ascosphaera aggregata]
MDSSSFMASNTSKALFSLLHDRSNSDSNSNSQVQKQSHSHSSESQEPLTQGTNTREQHASTRNYASKLEKKGFLSGPFQFLDHRARRGSHQQNQRSVSDAHGSISSSSETPQNSSSTETSRSDTTVSGNPATPQQTRPPPVHLRPAPITIHSPASRPSLAAAPCSPNTDPTTAAVYASASPASVLPRHSRGLDFSRAATQLHHSMLADASPDTSPIVATRAMAIPPGRRRSSERWNSLSGSPGGGGMLPSERLGGTGASSVSSINMLDAGSTDSSEEDDYDETDDEEEQEREERGQGEDGDGPFQGDEMMLCTPRSHRPQIMADGIVSTSSSSSAAAFLPNMVETPSAAAHTMPNLAWPATAAVPGATNYNSTSTAITMTPRSGTKASFKNYQRNRLRHGRGRHHAYSQGPYQNAMKYNGNAGPSFPGVIRSIETAAGGHFPAAATVNWDGHRSGGNGGIEMQFSDISDDEARPEVGMGSPSSIATNSNPEPGRPGVIRKAITRPRNLMPKPKPFNRIRAQLLEENAPLDFDVKREAEVIRQVRESEPDPQRAPSLSTQNESLNRAQDLNQQELPPNATSHARSNPDCEERESSFCYSSFSQDINSSISPGALANPSAFSLSGNAEGGTTGGGVDGGGNGPAGGLMTSMRSGTSESGSEIMRSPRYETPPPPPSRHSSDVFMETDTPPPLSVTPGVNVAAQPQPQPHSQSQGQSQSAGATGLSNASTVNALGARTSSAAGLPLSNANSNPNKRRRDDFMNFNTFKRRAVSPSVSVTSAQSSPKVAPVNRPGSISSESGNASFGSGNGNNSSTGSGTSLKRVGLQGMKETNDGFMNMRID